MKKVKPNKLQDSNIFEKIKKRLKQAVHPGYAKPNTKDNKTELSVRTSHPIITDREKENLAASIIKCPVVLTTVLNSMTKQLLFDCEPAVEEVVKFHDALIKNHGVRSGTARYNKIRLYCIMMLEHQNPGELSMVAVGKVDRWPSAFNKLRPLYYNVRDKKCSISDRCIRSILYINRLCKGNSKPDLGEILKEKKLDGDFLTRYDKYVRNAVKKTEGNFLTKPSTRVASVGPNRKPKWQTADIEAFALMDSEYNIPFKILCDATENQGLYNYMKELASGIDKMERTRLRHLLAIPDSGNKCRIVAVSDYWTQVILEPIMRDVQSYTRERFKDISYSDDHAKGFENLKRYIRPGIKCYDITSWTDAFPHDLQLCFMRARFGDIIANA